MLSPIGSFPDSICGTMRCNWRTIDTSPLCNIAGFKHDARTLAYDLARSTYKLDRPAAAGVRRAGSTGPTTRRLAPPNMSISMILHEPRHAILNRLVSSGAVAVLRLDGAADVLNVCRALVAGGVNVVELTMTTPGALSAVGMLNDAFGETLLVGMGSLLNVDDARSATAAGARFLVSPVFNKDVVSFALANEVPVMPGAYSPTEILTAHAAGADIVKVFPADSLGPAYLRGVLGPMPFLRLMPTGGVTPDNVVLWLRAGAVAVGLGSALVDPRLVATGDFGAIEQRARVVADAVSAFQRERAQ